MHFLWNLVFGIWIFSSASSVAATFSEDFSADPLARGWRTFGDASLFHWNTSSRNLEVTWDSARTNSGFFIPLGTILSRSDDFSLSFDLRLRDIAFGTSPDKPYTFEIGLGFLQLSSAIATNFYRGAGTSSVGPRNLVEFDYFPDSGFGATFSLSIAMTNHVIGYSHNFPLVMTTNDLYQVTMTFAASNRVLHTRVLKNGLPYSSGTSNSLADLPLSGIQDFRVDALAISSYSDAVQVGPPAFWGSVLAHGAVDNIVATVPDPPVRSLAMVRSNKAWRAQFLSRTNWQYTLERTTDLDSWAAITGTNNGTGSTITFQDTNSPSTQAFYRVRATKP